MPIIFQYGSNMSKQRIEQRVGSIIDLGRHDLKGYSLVFDVFSVNNNCGVANIIADETGLVIGRLFELTKEQLVKLDVFEGIKQGQYKKCKVGDFQTYVSIPKTSKHFLPSDEYLNFIITGLEEIEAPNSYKDTIKKQSKI